jgi:formylglycine-generating enzyme required for sulfatase activity
MRIKPTACVVAVLGLTSVACIGADSLTLPWSRATFGPEEGCRWQRDQSETPLIRSNGHYLAPPAASRDWEAWLAQLRAYRTLERESLRDVQRWHIELNFDGVRAWIRTGRPSSFAANLVPGEKLTVAGTARWREGGSRLCLAFDLCDRTGKADGVWRDWSKVIASIEIPRDGEWHDFEISATVPPFDAKTRWARPIIGMDGTYDATRGKMLLRNLELRLAALPERARQLVPFLEEAAKPSAPLNRAIYDRADLAWMERNFVCGFVFIYDREFWDPEARRYRVKELCDSAVANFGGYDSVVLWQAYPRIGADPRNQFDFFRDLPGGLEGLRRAVTEFHARRVKVFIPYNPWDQGTRRESESDDEALARVVAAIEADGIFLDTMVEAPAGLRAAVDARRRGVVFEPEGHPSVEELEQCNGSWAQWLQPFPGIGVLRLKWLEPRHMQHQVRRWDSTHRDELAAAWLNGSGMLVWENVFGAWNPWNLEDRATLRRMAPVLRFFAPVLSRGEWLPACPTLVEKTYASLWQGSGTRIWTIVNESGSPVEGPVLEVDDRGAQFFDLWRGLPIEPERAGGRAKIALSLEKFGAVAALASSQKTPAFDALLARQNAETLRRIEGGDLHMRADSVLKPLEPNRTAQATRPGPEVGGEMLSVEKGAYTFTVRHMRRECGCYPDPATPREKWHDFLRGTPHEETMEHHVSQTLASHRIDPRPVTNGEFEAFLRASGYQPAFEERLLAHWRGKTCPPSIKDEPVVYVDLPDARAYAAWAGKRLPSEWEWQRAAEVHGDRFARGAVWEWTESERDDGHTRFVMLRGGSRYRAEGSIWYFPGGAQPANTHAKFLLLYPGLDRCSTIGFRCVN